MSDSLKNNLPPNLIHCRPPPSLLSIHLPAECVVLSFRPGGERALVGIRFRHYVQFCLGNWKWESVSSSIPSQMRQKRANVLRFFSDERWNRGNRVIVPFFARREEDEQLLSKYKPPLINLHSIPSRSQFPTPIRTITERELTISCSERKSQRKSSLAGTNSL